MGVMDRLGRRRHPAQIVVAGFAATIAVGTVLLMLPFARQGPGAAGLPDALFTAASAVCLTGLTVVDTPAHWTGFGQAVILGLIQVGGFGIMTFASLLMVLVSHRLGLRARMTAAAETKTHSAGDHSAVGQRVLGGVEERPETEIDQDGAVHAEHRVARFLDADPYPERPWLGAHG
ncbi:potassium transporter TrkG [Streptomyces sp. H28]|uniref:potassium transporter TrkG n=1 Tax=Streptomyces sp. H28 TaxID=2775865 RepID=UPI001CE189E1|nr:potassium transporter TrkG [Streptomyces sp. H28]